MNEAIAILEDELAKWENDLNHPFMNKGCKGAIKALKLAIGRLKQSSDATTVVGQEESIEDKRLCGCGRPVRYIVPNGDGTTDACNKYSRCPTWDQLREQNESMEIKLSTAFDYCRELLGCWSWKKGQRAGNAEQYDELLTFIESKDVDCKIPSDLGRKTW